MEDQSKLADEAQVSTSTGETGQRSRYEVISEAGLFKNGQQFNKGETIELDEKAAKNFLSNNDIKEIQ